MRNDRYYGRIFKVPPLQQVRRELRAFIAVENVRELCAEAEGLPLDTSWSDLAERRAAVALSQTGDWLSASPSPQPTAIEHFTISTEV